MKTRHCNYCFVALIAALTWIPLATSAESKSTGPKREPAAVEGYDLAIVEGMLVSKGSTAAKVPATLANVVDALRDRYQEANIVMAPGLADAHIADVKLRASSLWDELEAIRVASGGKFEWQGPNSPLFGAPNSPTPSAFVGTPDADPSTGLPIGPPRTRLNSGLFVLQEPSPTPENQRVVDAFSLGNYLLPNALTDLPGEEESPGQPKPGQPANQQQTRERRNERVNQKLEQLKLIISETIVSLHQGPGGHAEQLSLPSFQFHPGANLLVVVGTREAVDVARKVMLALPGVQVNAAGPLPRAGAPAAAAPGFAEGQGLSPQAQEAFRRRYGLSPNPVPIPPPGQQPGAAPSNPNRP